MAAPPIGLLNNGNTCFMNSVLQCLSHTQGLSELTHSEAGVVIARNATSLDRRIWREFCRLLTQMSDRTGGPKDPLRLNNTLSEKYRMYGDKQQHDAHEFLRHLLNSLHGALNNGVQNVRFPVVDNLGDLEKSNEMWRYYGMCENSVIKDLFAGQLKSTLHCTHCGRRSVIYDPFWDLSVPLPEQDCTLYQCLELFTSYNGEDMPNCDSCRTRRCTQGLSIQIFPKYLIIQLKRFNKTRKLTTEVRFPTNSGGLDLSAYSADPIETLNPPPIYTLYSVSNHSGTMSRGHYVASCKDRDTNTWFKCDDRSVREIDKDALVSSSGYLLFYERV